MSKEDNFATLSWKTGQLLCLSIRKLFNYLADNLDDLDILDNLDNSDNLDNLDDIDNIDNIVDDKDDIDDMDDMDDMDDIDKPTQSYPIYLYQQPTDDQ